MSRIRLFALVLVGIIGLMTVSPRGQTPSPPILLVVNSAAANPYGRYLGEILRAEGINSFATVELSALSTATLNSAALVVLAETPLDAGQALMFDTYVAGGGRLVAMRPDARLAPTLGLTDLGSGSIEKYLAINAGTSTGAGFTSTTLPLVGPVKRYGFSAGASPLATLYTDRVTPTSYPAVVRVNRTVTWAYDLARSVVYTRQGNPANAGVERDGVLPVRTTDVFYGAIDLDRVNLPHADIQMRLLSRVIVDLLADRMPVPRLWYFPSAKRTLVIPTADTHVFSDPMTRQEIASVEAFGARLSMYISRWVPYPDATEAATWRASGHEFGVHPFGYADGVSLSTGFQTAVDWFTTHGLGTPSRTTRIHQLEWPTWVGPAQTEAAYGIGLDTTYYTWGPAVTYPDGRQAHGFINGSGLPMRFVDQAGTVIPVYQNVTSIIDEQLVVGDWSEHLTVSAALDVTRRLIDDSQSGGYSALVTQFHTDYYTWGEVLPWAEGTMDYARSLAIPMWTAERWLRFTEARAATQFTNISWTAPSLTFTAIVPAGSEPQSMALPADYAGLGVTSVTVGGAPVSTTTQTITGRSVLFFSVGPGTSSVVVTYNTPIPPVNHPPVAVNDLASTMESASVVVSVLANDGDPDGDVLTVAAVTQGSRGTVTINADNTLTYTAGPVCGADSFTYTISDGRVGTSTATVDVSIGCINGQITQTTNGDFASCGVFTSTMLTSFGDGEIRLAGTFGDEYTSATLDPGRWVTGTWSGGAYTPTLAQGLLSLGGANGAFSRSASLLSVTTLETTARFPMIPFTHVGWGALDFSGPYLMFSTYNSSTNLYARSFVGGSEQRTDLGPIPSGFHTFRIDRSAQTSTTDLVSYFIDGSLRAQHTVATAPALYVYQSHGGSVTPATLDIDRLWVFPPHIGSGTFTSCPIDAGTSVPWAAAAWNATLPTGATVSLATRTSSDGSAWSVWSAPLTVSGNPITSPAGRFIQYQLALGSTTSASSPIVDAVTITFTGSGDTIPPVVSTVVASGITQETATVSWATNEGATSQVQYGLTPTYGLSTSLDSTLVTSHSQTLAGLWPGTIYHYRVLSRDAAGNIAVSPDLTFATAPNNPPLAVNDSASVDQNNSVVIPVLTNDSDIDGHPLVVSSVTQGTFGTVTINPDNTVRYSAGPICGSDSFTYTISDGRGGIATATVSITIACTTGQITHTLVGDFASCGPLANTIVTSTGDGEVRLAGTVGDEYDGATLDAARWVSGTWSGGSYTPPLSGSLLSLSGANGAYVRSVDPMTVTSLETTARFTGAQWEHIGWGEVDLGYRYLLFSTFNSTTNLYARSTTAGGAEQRTDLGLIPTGFHTYRITRVAQDVTTDVISYYIDGVRRAQHTVATVPSLYVYQSHNGGTAPALDVDRLWVYPTYVGGGTFTSCTVDAGSQTTWTAAAWSAALPAGTSMLFATRTSGDGTTWSDWSAPLATSGSPITSPAGRYLQYQLDLQSTLPDASPVVEWVIIGFDSGTSAPPSLAISDVSVSEGNAGTTVASFTVSLSAASTQTVTVDFATADGTATAGTDYIGASGTLTFPAGVTSQIVSVTVNGDTTYEPDETFTVNLTNPTNATIADAQGVGTITNDDLPTLTINDVSVTEGNAGSVSASFTVTLSAASTQTVTVQYATANGTATAGSDYVAGTGTVTFAPGATGQSVNVTINGDALSEANETWVVNLTNPANAALVDAQGVGTIVDDDPLPLLSVNDVTVTEGNTGSLNATFTVTLSAASGQTVTVSYATADGTATAGSDYTARSGSLTFAAGTTSQVVTISVIGDTRDEIDETFFVNLSGAMAATIADAQGIGTILDNDATPSLTINNVTVTEGNTASVNATFTLSLSAASGQAVSVAYATANGTATAGSDYVAASGTLTIPAGSTSQTLAVVVSPDVVDELNETFFVNLSSPVNATIADNQGLGTINDNDATPSIRINNVSVTEGNTGSTNAAFTVTLTGTSDRTVTVNYTTANSTATAGADYTVSSGTLTFAPGTPSQTVTVPVLGDVLDEANETYFVNLSGAVNATIADSQGLGTITDNDPTPSLVINNVSVTEGNAGTVSAIFTVTLSAASGRTVAVNYTTANGTAVSPSDYVSTSGTLSFPAGTTTLTVTVLVNGDTQVEPNETFFVNLSGATNATIADSQGVCTIVNND